MARNNMEETKKQNTECGCDYYDKVKVKCVNCNTVQNNIMYYGLEDIKYKDDYFIECKICGNTEEGNGHMGNFELIEVYERVEVEGEY